MTQVQIPAFTIATDDDLEQVSKHYHILKNELTIVYIVYLKVPG